MAFVLCRGLYPCNLSLSVWEAKTALYKAATCDCHTLNCSTQLLLCSCPCFLWVWELIFQSFRGHHCTEAWQSVGAAGVSQFCEVSGLLASPPAELCWSLEELGAFLCPLYEVGDFAQRGRLEVKVAELFPSAVRTAGCFSGTAGAYRAFCSDR